MGAVAVAGSSCSNKGRREQTERKKREKDVPRGRVRVPSRVVESSERKKIRPHVLGSHSASTLPAARGEYGEP